ncbi:uncharacterized protein LOC121383545 [Gigantopelta aegis]|uniref:uncharacterized protein LOC121383545 n=1 Tax=Gigantopelta aegis TaxID=1735272 RepID=UPI001B88A9E8|nr:uncharacterized protein LOC121383545 [Gigantopelta aegis]
MSDVGAEEMQPDQELVELLEMDKQKLTKKQLQKVHDKEVEMARMKFQLEMEKLRMEREREKEEMNFRIKELELDNAKQIKTLEVELQKSKDTQELKCSSLSMKVKMQQFDVEKEDILTYLSEFEAVAQQAGWDDKVKVLQLRTLLPGVAREVARESSQDFKGLKRALVTRFGRRPADYFVLLDQIKRKRKETYRGLNSRIRMYVERFLDDKDPTDQLCEAFFLKALPPAQAQWIVRNKGSGSVVEAAEDYVESDTTIRENRDQHDGRNHSRQIKPDIKCFICHKQGHLARHCRKRYGDSRNQATFFIQNHQTNKLIYLPGKVNGKNISFVKDTGCELTLIKAKFVPPSCILEGQSTVLYTAVGQPFNAKLAVVEIDTPFYSGHVQVGVVPGLVEDALLGIDIIDRKAKVNAVTRAQAQAEEILEFPQVQKQMAETSEINENILPNAETLATQQREDETLNKIRETALKTEEEARSESSAFFWEDSILYRHWRTKDNSKEGKQLVVPQSMRKKILELAHDRPLAGHLSVEKTKQRIMARFYWPGVLKEVAGHCKTCDVCQKFAKKKPGEIAPMRTVPKVTEPFRKISMDIVGPLARTKKGNKFILTIVDEATRYPEAFALKSIEAEVIADKLIEMFSRTGVPEVILTDQGSNFTSTLMKQLYEILGVKGVTTSPYNPKANGVVERFNGTLKAMLKKLSMSGSDDWDVLLPYTLFAYREVPHQETGFAPFELLYGWPVRGPLDLVYEAMTGQSENGQTLLDHITKVRERLALVTSVVEKNLTRRHEYTKAWYDRKKQAKERKFWPGDQVLVLLPSSSKKMLAQWQGPFRVVKQVSDVNYSVQVGGR